MKCELDKFPWTPRLRRCWNAFYHSTDGPVSQADALTVVMPWWHKYAPFYRSANYRTPGLQFRRLQTGKKAYAYAISLDTRPCWASASGPVAPHSLIPLNIRSILLDLLPPTFVHTKFLSRSYLFPTEILAGVPGNTFCLIVISISPGLCTEKVLGPVRILPGFKFWYDTLIS